ncbi:MAG TPA: hypothetical protein VFQ53_21685 [Kofleriaceae bacterium]|nr:hypothetical protein [Kofleriaceae bacterium]
MSQWSMTNIPKKPERRALVLSLAFVASAALFFAAFSRQWLYSSATQLQLHEHDKTVAIGPVHEVGFGLRSMFACEQATCVDRSNGEFVEAWEKEVANAGGHVKDALQTLLEARFMSGDPVDDELQARVGAQRLETMKQNRDHLLENDPQFASQARRAVVDAEHEVQLANEAVGPITQAHRISSAWTTFGWITFVATLIGAVSVLLAAVLVAAKRRVALPIMPTTTALLGIGVALICGCVFVAVKPGPSGYVGVGVGFFAFGTGMILGLWSSMMLNRLLRPHDPDLLEDAMNPEQF